jgi:predicted MFS family arabinose efflux permease
LLSFHRLKAGYYIVTALAATASSYYFNYLFFFLRDEFGFGNRENLGVAALHGGIYVVASWQCGKFAERRGFHTSLKVGFAGLVVCMGAGAVANTAWLHCLILAAYTLSVCFLWPAIEALITEDEPPARVPHTVGLYNCTWSTASALAYFTGGSLYGWLGKGALFLLPGAVFLAEYFLVAWLQRVAPTARIPSRATGTSEHHPEPIAYRQPVSPQTFLRLAWVANPFSYVAIYTLLATMPALADRFGLSPARVGLVCSVWLFGRLASFIWLWHWSGWHYRFRFLVGGFALLGSSFVAILLAPYLWLMVAAQVMFGVTCGLMYYSSLFYSMDVGEAKAEHGGLHEAAIGVGICAGPAVGAASLQFFPTIPHASAVAVSGLLAVGFITLVTIWAQAKAAAGRSASSRAELR